MITNAILFLVYIWVDGIALLLSSAHDVTPTPWIVSSVTTTAGYLNLLWSIMPYTIAAIVGGALVSILAFELILATYKLIKWGYQKIPGIS
jgi:hypothetical protein